LYFFVYRYRIKKMPASNQRKRASRLRKKNNKTEGERCEHVRLERHKRRLQDKYTPLEQAEYLKAAAARMQDARMTQKTVRSKLEQEEYLKAEAARKDARMTQKVVTSELEQEEYLKAEAARKQDARMMQKAVQKDEADLSRASFPLEAMNPSVHFDNFEDHPEAAVMLYHLNSGHGQFELLNDLIQEANGNEGVVDGVRLMSLGEEIELENLKPEELEKLVETFQSFQGREYI
jgi:hypothetical protein